VWLREGQGPQQVVNPATSGADTGGPEGRVWAFFSMIAGQGARQFEAPVEDKEAASARAACHDRRPQLPAGRIRERSGSWG